MAPAGGSTTSLAASPSFGEGREPPSEMAQVLTKRVSEVADRCRGLQDTAEKYSVRLKSEGDAMGEAAIALSKEIKELLAAVNAASEKDEIANEAAEQLEEELLRARSMVYEGDVAALLPHKANGWFLSLLLGQVNVRFARRDARLKVKEEYNSYRDRTAVLFLAVPLMLLGCKWSLDIECLPGFIMHFYQVMLLIFYLSLALRENILRINGSDIRPWWIYHHYCAILMAIVSLTWGIEGPGCVKKQAGIGLFLWWAVLQGVAMLLQNRYQRRRLYARIALGKAGRMDVVWGETAGMKGQLLLLYPLLFVLQAFQAYIGLQLLQSSLHEAFEWQVPTCGCLLVFMALGNFSNTVATMVAKMRIKTKMRRRGREMLKSFAGKDPAQAGKDPAEAGKPKDS